MSQLSQALQTVNDYIVVNPSIVNKRDFSILRTYLKQKYPDLTIQDGYDIDKLFMVNKTDDDRYWLSDYGYPNTGDVISGHVVLETGIFTFQTKKVIDEDTESSYDFDSQYASKEEIDVMINKIRTIVKHNPSITMDKLREFAETFDIVSKSKLTFDQAVYVDNQLFGCPKHDYWSLVHNHPNVGDMVEGDIVNSVGIFTFGTKQIDSVGGIEHFITPKKHNKRSRSNANDFSVDYDEDFENAEHISIRQKIKADDENQSPTIRTKERADAHDFGVEYEEEDSEVDDENQGPTIRTKERADAHDFGVEYEADDDENQGSTVRTKERADAHDFGVEYEEDDSEDGYDSIL
jgi:hypothetical protein